MYYQGYKLQPWAIKLHDLFSGLGSHTKNKAEIQFMINMYKTGTTRPPVCSITNCHLNTKMSSMTKHAATAKMK